MKLPISSLIVFSFLVCSAIPPSVAPTDKQHASCLDHNSPDKTITRCTEIINQGDKELPSDLAAAYKNRGNAYLFNGKIDNAIADFTAAIRLKPDVETYTSRGAAYYQKGDDEHAKADWAEAKRLKEPGKSKQ